MIETYLATYTDAFGEETTTIENDGHLLRMTLRGVVFQGTMLDDWQPTHAIPVTTSFAISDGVLHAYTLFYAMPVTVVVHDKSVQGVLRVTLSVGTSQKGQDGDYEDLQIELCLNGQSFRSCGQHGWFEDEFRELNALLPPGTYIKSCFNCAFSDYNPAGFGLFGCMACFRNNKQAYLALTGKAAYFNLQDQIAQHVQETYLCTEFKKRVPGTGYRG